MNRSPLRNALTKFGFQSPFGKTAARRGATRSRPALESLEGRALLAAGLTEFPGPFLNPSDLVSGSDGNIWVLNSGDSGNSSFTVVGADGTVKASYSIPTADAYASAATLGPDGNVWFVEQSADKVGKITPAGAVTEYPIANLTGGDAPVDLKSPGAPDGVVAMPTSIVAGSDGALWFTESSADAIGRITTDGAITQTPVAGSSPNSIALGPDKMIWFTDNSFNNTIDRLNADGSVSKFPLPSTFAMPGGMTTGPDGALWFVESLNNAVGRISTSGQVTEFPIQADFSSPERLTFDASGNVWVSGSGGGLARLTQNGLTVIVSPQTSTDPINTQGITTLADGSIWFTDTTSNQVGRVDPTTVTTLPTDHPLRGVQGYSAYAGDLNFSDSVASFYDGNPSSQASDFSAQISWGDGTTSDGTVVAHGNGSYTVNGTHTFAQYATYAGSVTITDVNLAHTPQPNTLTIATSIEVDNQPIPTPLPPIFSVNGPAGTPGGSSKGRGASQGGVANTTSSTGKSPTPVVKKTSGTPSNVPSAVTLLRAGYVPQWFMAGHYHPAQKTVTTPTKPTHVTPVVKPAKPVKHGAKKGHKGH